MSFSLSKVTGSTNQLAAESIARKGAFRVDAVLKLLETNDWDGVALATMVSSGKVGNIEYTVRYSNKEALKLSSKTGHYGPWDSKVNKAFHGG